jgi:hypothetical protein
MPTLTQTISRKDRRDRKGRDMNIKMLFVFDLNKSVLGVLGVLARGKSFLYEIHR